MEDTNKVYDFDEKLASMSTQDLSRVLEVIYKVRGLRYSYSSAKSKLELIRKEFGLETDLEAGKLLIKALTTPGVNSRYSKSKSPYRDLEAIVGYLQDDEFTKAVNRLVMLDYDSKNPFYKNMYMYSCLYGGDRYHASQYIMKVLRTKKPTAMQCLINTLDLVKADYIEISGLLEIRCKGNSQYYIDIIEMINQMSAANIQYSYDKANDLIRVRL